MPGIARRSAEVILAETGIDMSRFPSAAHLCSWAGVCSDNNQSAGKRYHGKTRKGNKTLKSMPGAVRQGGQQSEGLLFCGQYQRIAATRGKKPGDHGRGPLHAHRYLPCSEGGRFHSVIWERIITTASAENIKFGTT